MKSFNNLKIYVLILATGIVMNVNHNLQNCATGHNWTYAIIVFHKNLDTVTGTHAYALTHSHTHTHTLSLTHTQVSRKNSYGSH